MRRSRNDNFICIFFAILLIIYLISKINDQVVEHYNMKDPLLNKIIIKCKPLFTTEYYNPDVLGVLKHLNKRNILDDITIMRGDNSYTINKRKVYICMKDENGKYYNENMLTYVLLHELAHVICDEIGHTQKFHQIFEKLLERAVALKIYDNSKELIFNYCKKGDPEMKRI